MLVGVCTFSTPAAHAAGAAIHLNNLSDSQGGWIRVPDNASLRLQAFTVEMWIKPLGPGYGHTEDAPGAALFAKPDEGGVGGGPLSYHMGWCPTTEKLDFLLTNTPPNTYVNFTSNGLAPLNVWSHVAFTFDGSQMRIFLNGIADSSTPYPYPSVYYGPEPILIGAGNYLVPFLRRYQGLIDDVRLWNFAKSATQVADQMNCSLGGQESGLVAYWKMDGDLLDATGNASNGALVGAATYVGDSVATTPCATTDVPRALAPSRISLTSRLNATRDLVSLAFTLPAEGPVSLAVFDLSGRRLVTLLDHVTLTEGLHESSMRAGALRSGIYFARLQAGPQSATCTLMISR